MVERRSGPRAACREPELAAISVTLDQLSQALVAEASKFRSLYRRASEVEEVGELFDGVRRVKFVVGMRRRSIQERSAE